jgi:trans-aconitate 2-methyltransferase
MTDPWNPARYARFLAEREQPFYDLLAMIQPAPHMRIVDLGCGMGRLTTMLHDRLRADETIGIDRSARMLESAQPAEGVRFEVGTIENFNASPEYDLVFSNAALHWVDDHDALIPRLAAAVRKGGQIAFQVPALHDDPSHRVAEELAGEEPFRSGMAGWHRRQPVLAPDAYARLLYRAGFSWPQVRLVVYPHVLDNRDAVVEWMKGSLLTEYERHLPPDLFPVFLEAYRTRLVRQLEPTEPFFFPFNRILCWGRRTA